MDKSEAAEGKFSAGAPGSDEIEITPAMIEAGARAIGLLFEEPGASRAALRTAAEECFGAMLSVRP